jgi:hypothetical protein
MGAGGSLSGGKGPGLKLTTHLHLMPRPKMVELYSHSSDVFMAWCLIKYRDSFTFYLYSEGRRERERFVLFENEVARTVIQYKVKPGELRQLRNKELNNV